MDCRKLLGFTLVELLVSLAIGAVLLFVAAPVFTSIVRAGYLSTQTHLFVSAVNYARTEAIQRKQTVFICARLNNHCQNNQKWEQGWLIFVDENRNGALDNDELIQVSGGFEVGYTLRPNVSASNLLFRSDGVVRRGTGALPLMTFRLCAPDAGAGNLAERSREIVINATGRMRLQFGRELAGAC
ncbi:MAG: GspH/FimT family pseudopilin [Pseudomonadales bacterium]